MNITYLFSDIFTVSGTNDETLEHAEWTSPRSISLEEALEKAQEFVYCNFPKIVITSATTGEIVAQCEADEDDEAWDEDFDDDVDECGYNPYMGCYDYDC